MEVRFVVPEDIVRKVEYIPEKVLPDVLTEVFRAGFESIIEKQTVRKKQDIFPTETLEFLLAAVASLPQPVKPESGMSAKKDEPVDMTVDIGRVMPELEEDDEDLGDLLGMLK